MEKDFGFVFMWTRSIGAHTGKAGKIGRSLYTANPRVDESPGGKLALPIGAPRYRGTSSVPPIRRERKLGFARRPATQADPLDRAPLPTMRVQRAESMRATPGGRVKGRITNRDEGAASANRDLSEVLPGGLA